MSFKHQVFHDEGSLQIIVEVEPQQGSYLRAKDFYFIPGTVTSIERYFASVVTRDRAAEMQEKIDMLAVSAAAGATMGRVTPIIEESGKHYKSVDVPHTKYTVKRPDGSLRNFYIRGYDQNFIKVGDQCSVMYIKNPYDPNVLAPLSLVNDNTAMEKQIDPSLYSNPVTEITSEKLSKDLGRASLKSGGLGILTMAAALFLIVLYYSGSLTATLYIPGFMIFAGWIIAFPLGNKFFGEKFSGPIMTAYAMEMRAIHKAYKDYWEKNKATREAYWKRKNNEAETQISS